MNGPSLGRPRHIMKPLPALAQVFFPSLITPIRRRVTARIYLQNEPVRQYSSSAQITGTVAGTIVGITKNETVIERTPFYFLYPFFEMNQTLL